MKVFLRLQTVLLSLFAAAIFGSCITDRVKDPVPARDNSTVTLTISVPANSQPSTRALAESDEYSVNEVAVLVFDKTAKTFQGRYQGRITVGPTGTGGASAAMQFEVSLPMGGFDLMVVANGGAILNENNAVLTVGTSQTAIEKALKATMTTSGWASDNSGSSHRIPMWGYKTGVDIPDSFPISTITLVRMVAKVDVQLVSSLVDDTDVAESKFQLRSVRVYNYVEQGRLIPNTGGSFNWTAVSQGNLANNTAPALPDGYTKADNTSGSEEYIERTVTLTADNRYQFLRGELYLFESPKGVAPASGSGDFLDNTCLVIGGSFNNGPVTYYRIDFATRSVVDGVVTYTYMPILRNNSYTVTITDVTGTGHGSEEDALRSAPTNITANILNWSNNDIQTIVTDGVYMLGVSKNSYLFPRDPRGPYESDNKLTIVTNSSGGWSATVWDDEAGTVPLADDGTTGLPWLRLSQSSGTGNYDSGDEIYFNIDENKDATDRTAWIHIKAGTLSYKVKVVQKYMFIMITDVLTGDEITDLSFSSKKSTIGVAPIPRQVKVTWSPTTETVYVTKADGNPTLAWQAPYQTVLAGGEYTMTIDPHGISQSDVDSDPFIVKSAELNFTLGLTSVTANLAIEQTYYSLSTSNFIDITSAVVSRTGAVKSNAPWDCTWTSDMISGGMTLPSVSPVTNAGIKTGAAFHYTFQPASEGRVVFTFAPADINKQFDPVSVVVNASPLPLMNPEILGFGDMIAKNTSYTGAFWRADQRGERLIRIPVETSANYGQWAVQVYDYGDYFEPGDIQFSTEPTADPGVIWNPESDIWDTGRAELHTDPDVAGYYVDTDRTFAIGSTKSSDTYIEFRVGLRTKWSEQPDYDPVARPARYAVLVIAYGPGYIRQQKIFLRQGHEPDYLMLAGDPDIAGDLYINGRKDARRWSAYNLTAAGLTEEHESIKVYRRPAYAGEDVSGTGTSAVAFTDYPTKTGAYFQSLQLQSNIEWHRRAFHPSKPSYTGITTSPYWFWDEALFETCPEGYRRPDMTRMAPNSNFDTETAHSFMVHQQGWSTSGKENSSVEHSAFGYYADGYFDRLQPVKGDFQAELVFNGPSVVAYNTKEVAYIGLLIVNPIRTSANYNASLFFPASGFIYVPSGQRVNEGTSGYFLSRSPNTYSNTSGLGIYNEQGNFQVGSGYDKGAPASIRCVVDETD